MSESLVALMRSLTLGVYVIGVYDGEKPNAFTACSVMPVSFDPVLLTVAIGRDHASLRMLLASGQFSVNVLKREQLALARHFGECSGRDEDKLARVPWRPGPAGTPLLDDALACLACEVHGTMRTGDHELVVGRVVSGIIQGGHARPMTYADTGDMDGSADLYAQRRVAEPPAPHESPEHH